MLNEFNTGGTHAQNRLGGIPFGTGPDGQPITVEEGETSMNTGDGRNFIFSDRVNVSKKFTSDLKLPTSLAGKSVAEVSKYINKMFVDRADNISERTKNSLLDKLGAFQEEHKASQKENLSNSLNLNSQQVPDMMNGQIPAGMEQFQGSLDNQQQFYGGGFTSNGIADDSANLGDNPVNPVNSVSPTSNANFSGQMSSIAGIGNMAISAMDHGKPVQSKGGAIATGALSGAAAGAMFGPWGAAAGAVVGGTVGLIKNNKDRKVNDEKKQMALTQQNKLYADNYAMGGFTGGVPLNSQQHMLDGINYNIGQLNSNPTMRAQKALVDNGYKINVDGKWGPQSIKAQQSLAKAAGVNLGKETAPNNDLLGLGVDGLGINPYNTVNPNAGKPIDYAGQIGSENYQPWSATPNEIQQGMIDNGYNANPNGTRTVENTAAINNKRANMLSGLNDTFRYSPILANLKNTRDLTQPTMKTPMLEESKAQRRYVDEAGIIRNADNVQNSTVSALSESGVTGGALRNSILATQLNRQRGISEAYASAKNANDQIDNQADMIDYQTRATNRAERLRVDDTYDKDSAAYRNAKREGIAQMGNDLGNVGLENQRISAVEKINGYSIDGEYIKNNTTGERYNGMQLEELINSQKSERAQASTDAEKRKMDAEIAKNEQLLYTLGITNTKATANTKKTK